MSSTILITGATGSQGSATIKALVASHPDTTIHALVRDPGSSKSKALASLSTQVKLFTGTFDDIPSITAAAKACHPPLSTFPRPSPTPTLSPASAKTSSPLSNPRLPLLASSIPQSAAARTLPSRAPSNPSTRLIGCTTTSSPSTAMRNS